MAGQMHTVEFVEEEVEQLQTELREALNTFRTLKDASADFKDMKAEYAKLVKLITEAERQVRSCERRFQEAKDVLEARHADMERQQDQRDAEILQKTDAALEGQAADIADKLGGALAQFDKAEERLLGRLGLLDVKFGTLMEEHVKKMAEQESRLREETQVSVSALKMKLTTQFDKRITRLGIGMLLLVVTLSGLGAYLAFY